VRGFSQQQTRRCIPVVTLVCSVCSARQNFDLQPICPSAPPCVWWCLLALPVVLASISIAPRLFRLPLRLYFGLHCRVRYLHVHPGNVESCNSISSREDRATSRWWCAHSRNMEGVGIRRVPVFDAAATCVAPAPDHECGLLSTSKTSPEATPHGFGVIIVLRFLGVYIFLVFCPLPNCCFLQLHLSF
jgi:hypothetical protein